MKTIFILMDSLNRHYLNCYGDSWIETPNLDRLAKRSVLFDNHYCGSMPCMPARRDMFTSRINFLETPWGPIEPWDTCLQPELRQQKGVYSHLITDHYHYFHRGGYNYHTQFNSWEFLRGQEGDVWRPLVDAPEPPDNYRGKGGRNKAYWRNREFMDPENDLDYPTPQCFQQAVEFVENNQDADDWLLHLELFDPHEPFDTPTKYRAMYSDTWDGYLYNWPAYDRLDPEFDDQDAVNHIRKRYAAALTMADHWLGKLLDKLDETNAWDDTCVILTTDHGHLLGEHGFWAKNYMFDYSELTHIPLMIAAPDIAGGRRVKALTTTIDIPATIVDLFDAHQPKSFQGKSLLPLLEKDQEHHDAVLYGYFGKDVNLTDGRYTYCRQPKDGAPIHLHTATPVDIGGINAEKLHQAELGDFLPAANGIPVYRLTRYSHRHHDAPDGQELVHDLQNDPQQENPVSDPDISSRLRQKLVELLERYEAPDCQYKRLKLDK